MLNTAKRRRPQDADAVRSGADAVSWSAGFKHAAAVVFALCATIAIVAGLGFVAETPPQADAQTCTIPDPNTYNGEIEYVGANGGAWPSHRVEIVFPQTAYVSEVIVTSSRTNIGNESQGKWKIDVNGQTYESGSGVKVEYTSGKKGDVKFTFDKPIHVTAGTKGTAYITLFGQSGAKSNYTFKYKGGDKDPCPAASPTPPPATPTSAAPAPTTAQPTTSPNSTTTTQPSTSATSAQPTSDGTSTAAPTTTVDPHAGTGETPTIIRPAKNGEVGIRVSAAAFRNDTTQYSSGIRFRLWTADESGDYFTSSDRGPQQPINADWATCVTGATGECVIYVPSSFAGEYAFVVQENEYPGTFHIGRINWGKFGNYNNRTNGYLPGFVNLSMARIGATDPYWGKMFPLSSSEISTWDEIRSFGSSVQSLNNPPMEKARKCQASGGPRIALVMDTTTSISDAKGTERYRDAVYGSGGLLDSLVGTGASVAFFPFATTSKTNLTFAEPVPVDTNLALAKDNAKKALSNIGGTTNWQSGFESVLNSGQKYDQIIFVTDGDANTWFDNGATDSVNVDGSVKGVEAGTYAANQLKAQGMRIVSIGVASADSAAHWNGSGQLKAVSGPQYGVDYFGTDWNRLAASLRAAASEVTCQIDFEVNKVIVDAAGNKLADQSAAAGWQMDLGVSNLADPQSDLSGTTEKAPFGYLSGDADQKIMSASANTTGKTYGDPAKLRWTLTQYADPTKINTSAVIRENVSSKSGFEFVPGASTFEVQDSRTGAVTRRGQLQSSQQSFTNLKPGDRVVVTMVNRLTPEITLQKDLPNGRKKDSDQFQLDISKVTGAQNGAFVDARLGNAVTTQGTSKGVQQTADGKTLQAGPFKLEPNTTYLLRENGANNANIGDYDTSLQCSGATAQPVPESKRSGTGRVWQVQTGSNVTQNISCTFTNKPVLSSSISWKKVDNENKPLACSQWQLTRTKDEKGAPVSGQAWAVNDNASNANCSFQNSGLQNKQDVDSAGGSFKVNDLPLGTYTIEEVRAPDGYAVSTDRYKAEVVLDAASASTGVTVKDAFINYPSVKTPESLPRTGGSGIGLPAGIAAAIIAFGCALLRRQRA